MSERRRKRRGKTEHHGAAHGVDDEALALGVREALDYAGFGPDDADRLAASAALVRPALPAIARAFYERMQAFEGASGVLRDEAHVEQLRGSMERWLESLFSGRYDDAFARMLVRVGHVHAGAGVPARFVPAASALLREKLGAAMRAGGATAEQELALHRLLDAQSAVLVAVQDAHAVARAQRLERAEQRQLREQLAELEARHPEVVDLAQLFVLGLDGRGEVRFASGELTRALGRSQAELVGRPFGELLESEREPEELERARQEVLVASIAHYDTDLVLAPRTGPLRRIRARIGRPAIAPEGPEEVALLVVGRDVTDERARTELAQQHERLVAMGTLVAGLAHEIRNPLHGALLHLQVLERAIRGGTAGADAQEARATVQHELTRLSTLLDEFLAFARPRPLQISETSLRGVLERVRDAAASRATAAHVTIEITPPSLDVSVRADAERLGVLFEQLVRNAIEAIAASRRGARVVLALSRGSREVIVEVHDDGPGIPQTDTRVLDVFYSTKPEGTGLGLPLAHRIASDHGGQLTYESRPGSTTFRVTLPTTA